MDEASRRLRALNLDEYWVVYKSPREVEVSATRTDKICPHDFAVGLLIPGRPIFYPTHIRLLVDLYLKNLSDRVNAKELFAALEQVYIGEDPAIVSAQLSNINFDMQLDEPVVNLYYTQLLMIEQEFNYGPLGCKSGKVNPPRAFLMGFIRWTATGEEIDRILQGAVRNYPPPKKYLPK
jgi:hypothetical protein